MLCKKSVNTEHSHQRTTKLLTCTGTFYNYQHQIHRENNLAKANFCCLSQDKMLKLLQKLHTDPSLYQISPYLFLLQVDMRKQLQHKKDQEKCDWLI